MESVITLVGNFIEHYLSVVFAKSQDATLVGAAIYSVLAFTAMYFITAGLTWIFLRKRTAGSTINTQPLKPQQIRAEVMASMVSIAMFSLLTVMLFLVLSNGWLQVSGNVTIGQWVLEVLVLFLWNEIHFYFTHRLMHTKWLYQNVHKEHHRSVVVTPFAAYRFHWLEALLLGAVLPMAVIFYNFSMWSLLLLPPLSLAWNVVGHSNYRPTFIGLAWLARASERHAAHHSKFKGNYGFALPYLDIWGRTKLTD